MVELDSATPEIYFQNTNTWDHHASFVAHLGLGDNWYRGWLYYYPNILLYGDAGVFTFALLKSSTASEVERLHTLLAANLPMVDHNLAYDPWNLPGLPNDWVHVANPRVPVVG